MECFQMQMFYLQQNLLMEYQLYLEQKMFQIKKLKIKINNSNIYVYIYVRLNNVYFFLLDIYIYIIDRCMILCIFSFRLLFRADDSSNSIGYLIIQSNYSFLKHLCI